MNSITNWRSPNGRCDTRRESLRLTQTRQGGGVSTLLDLRQAEQLVNTAAETIPALQQQIEQTENQISLLLGNNPGDVPRGRALTGAGNAAGRARRACPPPCSNAGPISAPPSRIWSRPTPKSASPRPPTFRRLSLTGLLGGQSTQLSSLFSGPHSAWSFVPQVSQPIFTAGRLKSGVQLTEAQKESAVIQYQKTIQTAFTEVSNALIAHQRVRESRTEQEALVVTLQDRTRLAYLRYRGGVDTQLNALDADRDLFQAELTLSQIKLNELLSVVQLYKALGGGWE